MAAIDDLKAAAARIEQAVTDLLGALGSNDLKPVTDALNQAAQQAEDTLNPPAPAEPAPAEPVA